MSVLYQTVVSAVQMQLFSLVMNVDSQLSDRDHTDCNVNNVIGTGKENSPHECYSSEGPFVF
ncbi:hypothetical protein CA11_09480 [Gimesia maris]|nr:hypothetical protein CA11_09480 [Gimesia maris]